MAIIPAGKTRLMVSQVISTPTAPGYNDGEPQLAPEEISDEGMGNDLPDIPEVPEEVPESPEAGLQGIPEDNKPTLTDYIFKTLEGFGYPGRRLEEFKKKFVKKVYLLTELKILKLKYQTGTTLTKWAILKLLKPKNWVKSSKTSIVSLV